MQRLQADTCGQGRSGSEADHLFDTALKCFDKQAYDAADKLCQQALSSAANQHLGSLLLRGQIAYLRQHFDLAEKCFASCARLQPDSAIAHFNWANALREQGASQNALSRYLKVLQLDPGHVEAHYSLANLLKRLGRLDAALEHYSQAISLDSDHALAHNNMGNILNAMGRFREAIPCYQQALRIQPDFAAANYNLAISYQSLGHYDAAVNLYLEALKLEPDLAPAHANLGTVWRILGKVERAREHYQKAIELAPGRVEAHLNLAALYERTNQLTEARECIGKALELAPGNASCRFVHAVILRRSGKPDEALRSLGELEDGQLPEEFIIRRYFETGKILDSKGEYAQAFAAYVAGNQRQRYSSAAARADKNRFLERIDSVRQLVDSGWQPSGGGTHGSAEPAAPAFLLGFPRSGTTLIDQALDAHPQIQVLEEQHLLAGLARELAPEGSFYTEGLKDLDPATIRALRGRYFAAAEDHIRLATGALLVDKMPLNIEYLPLIRQIFPESRYLFAVRQPCDVVLSNFFQYYQLNDAMANFLTLEDTITAYRSVMRLWSRCEAQLSPEVKRVSYESLVGDLEGNLRDIFDFLQLPWCDQSLDFHQHAQRRSLISTPSYEQVMQPVYKSSVDRWRNYQSQLEPYLDQLKQLGQNAQ